MSKQKEIKFRAWDKKQNRMTEPRDLHSLLIGVGRWGEYIEDFDIMQFTGLKDKNGKESYDGDIVKDSRGDIYKIEYGYIAVLAKSKMAAFGLVSVADYYPSVLSDGQDIEIIGNIYENPELLK